MFMMATRSQVGLNVLEINCLQPINYDRLILNKERLKQIKKPTTPVYNPSSLEVLSCKRVCDLGEGYCAHVMSSAPTHLAPLLLREAFRGDSTAIVPFVANWPLQDMCFREILPEEKRGVFKAEMYIDLLIFKGVSGRTRKCKLECMDLRGLELNPTFIKLIIQMWPILSLKKRNRNVKRLTDMVLTQANLKKDNRLATEIIPKLITDMLSHERALPLHSRYSINIPAGKRMVVMIDKLEFTTQTNFFMDYLITHCLRKVTPLSVQVANIVIRSELNIGDEILDSLAPFIVFRGHEVETLKGIWLGNLEDNVFFIVRKDFIPYTSIHALGVPNCNIALQEGRTRRRTRNRHELISTLSGFPYLVRLDLTQNCFAGCLSEILEGLTLPLEYLNVKDCDLYDKDLEYLANSRHAKSLKYLNLSRICGLFPDDEFAVTSTCLVKHFKNFPNVSVIHAQQNQVGDTKCNEICDTLTKHWKCIKGINLSDNVLGQEACFKIARAATKVKSIQYLRLPHAHNLLEHANQLDQSRRDYVQKLNDILKDGGRPDIEIDVLSLAFAILGNW